MIPRPKYINVFLPDMHTALYSLYRTVTNMISVGLLIMSKHFCLPKLDSGCELFSHGPTWSFPRMTGGGGRGGECNM